jgi:hypothetical protein
MATTEGLKEGVKSQSSSTSVANPLFEDKIETASESKKKSESKNSDATNLSVPLVSAGVTVSSKAADKGIKTPLAAMSSPVAKVAAVAQQMVGIEARESHLEDLLQKLVWFGIIAGLAAVLLSGILTLLQ